MELSELIEEKWDEHSIHIGNDIDEAQYWSGRSVIKEADFKQAVEEIVKDQSTVWAVWKEKAEVAKDVLELIDELAEKYPCALGETIRPKIAAALEQFK